MFQLLNRARLIDVRKMYYRHGVCCGLDLFRTPNCAVYMGDRRYGCYLIIRAAGLEALDTCVRAGVPMKRPVIGFCTFPLQYRID